MPNSTNAATISGTNLGTTYVWSLSAISVSMPYAVEAMVVVVAVVVVVVVAVAVAVVVAAAAVSPFSSLSSLAPLPLLLFILLIEFGVLMLVELAQEARMAKIVFHPLAMLAVRAVTICFTALRTKSATSGEAVVVITVSNGRKKSCWKL